MFTTKQIRIFMSETTEVKTNDSFSGASLWFYKSRGTQTLAALYAFNAPTMLLTQRKFKLFVENPARNEVYTFPYEDSSNENEFRLAVSSSLQHSIP